MFYKNSLILLQYYTWNYFSHYYKIGSSQKSILYTQYRQYSILYIILVYLIHNRVSNFLICLFTINYF